MVCFEVFYFEFTINLPPPTGGGLVQRFAALRSGGIFSTALDTKNHSSNLAQIFIRRTSARL